MRWLAATGDEAEQRTARGEHAIILEDGDQGPALQTLAPHLFQDAPTVAGELAMSIGSAGEVSLAFMQCNDPAALVAYFYRAQVAIEPLNRSYQIIRPGLKLEDVTPGSTAAVLNEHTLRVRIVAFVQTLDPADKDRLRIVAADLQRHRSHPDLLV